MRIIKLGTVEFPSIEDVRRYFENDLPRKEPPGKFRIPQNLIGKNGLKKGEKLLFSYRGTICYLAMANSGRINNTDKRQKKYPYFFLIDIDTLQNTRISLLELENQLKLNPPKSIVRSRSWPKIQDNVRSDTLWDSLYNKGTNKTYALWKKYGDGGESAEHKLLKEWIAKNPQVIGLTNVRKVEMEHVYISGDAVDLLFELNDDNDVVVEIETIKPLPGCYQAIKYKALRCAERGLSLSSPNIRAAIVAWAIPSDVKEFCTKYNINYIKKKI